MRKSFMPGNVREEMGPIANNATYLLSIKRRARKMPIAPDARKP